MSDKYEKIEEEYIKQIPNDELREILLIKSPDEQFSKLVDIVENDRKNSIIYEIFGRPELLEKLVGKEKALDIYNSLISYITGLLVEILVPKKRKELIEEIILNPISGDIIED